jgi:LPS export ABC transporter protein LptC
MLTASARLAVVLCATFLATCVGLTALPIAAAEGTGSPPLRIEGMTFVGSRGELREVVLRSRIAIFRPDARTAELEEVSAEVSQGEGGRSFTMTCRRAEFDVDSQDFMAEGQVEGATSDGRRYYAPWVRYDHEAGLLYTDAPVRMVDDTGSFRGDGFRYHVKERRFQLLGNVRVEQTP